MAGDVVCKRISVAWEEGRVEGLSHDCVLVRERCFCALFLKKRRKIEKGYMFNDVRAMK